MQAKSRILRAIVMVVLLAVGAAPALAADPVIPLPADVAKDLAVFGPGVVGKALPAPPLEDVEAYLHPGDGDWKYRIVAGDTDEKVRVESYQKIPSPGGSVAWKRSVGETYAEYLRLDQDGVYGKYAEDDLSIGYGALIDPAIMVHAGMKPGDSVKSSSKLRAFKMGHPRDIKYKGKMDSEVRYVGAYEVTTPAGTWPALLFQSRFTVDIGPAKVTDTMYLFFSKGVGKVAELEGLKVAALFVYHSNQKAAKVLTAAPRLDGK